jgi:hypothetical protein
MHTEPKNLSCEYCGETFQRREHRDRHLLRHTGLKPFLCHICSKSFSRKSVARGPVNSSLGLADKSPTVIVWFVIARCMELTRAIRAAKVGVGGRRVCLALNSSNGAMEGFHAHDALLETRSAATTRLGPLVGQLHLLVPITTIISKARRKGL